MTNSGSQTPISVIDSTFQEARERLYLEQFERTTSLALSTVQSIRVYCPVDGTQAAVAELLELLGDTEPAAEVDASMKQGATYKQLAYIGHLAKLDDKAPGARKDWYAEAGDIGLTKRHAGHIIARLNEISQGTAELEEYVRDAE
jgi:hypothetical protein